MKDWPRPVLDAASRSLRRRAQQKTQQRVPFFRGFAIHHRQKGSIPQDAAQFLLSSQKEAEAACFSAESACTVLHVVDGSSPQSSNGSIEGWAMDTARGWNWGRMASQLMVGGGAEE